jgi:hypothetical protein
MHRRAKAKMSTLMGGRPFATVALLNISGAAHHGVCISRSRMESQFVFFWPMCGTPGLHKTARPRAFTRT